MGRRRRLLRRRVSAKSLDSPPPILSQYQTMLLCHRSVTVYSQSIQSTGECQMSALCHQILHAHNVFSWIYKSLTSSSLDSTHSSASLFVVQEVFVRRSYMGKKCSVL